MEISRLLLDWYDKNRRVFPFRGISDPYRIWISEIMLQQTRTGTAAPYWERFVSAFPDVKKLADAAEEDVLRYWAGLGYYSRARNLHRAAQIICRDFGGSFPVDYEAIRSLPGIGDYTAAAIASIAFDAPIPAMDGNLYRIFARLADEHGSIDRPATRTKLRETAEKAMPLKRCGDFNQALMDLGAGICIAGIPSCEQCPLRMECMSEKKGTAAELPVRDIKKAPSERRFAVVIATEGNTIALFRRDEKLLKNMWVYLLLENAGEAELNTAFSGCTEIGSVGRARHVFTHQIWEMEIWHVKVPEGWECDTLAGCRWCTPEEQERLPMPAAMRAAKEAAAKILEYDHASVKKPLSSMAQSV